MVNKDGCDEKYIRYTLLYSLSILDNVYDNIIGLDIGLPGQGKDVVDGLNPTHKNYVSILISTTKLSG